MKNKILKTIGSLFILAIPTILFSQDFEISKSDWFENITYRFSTELEDIKRKESETASMLQEHMIREEENQKAYTDILKKIIDRLEELQNENDELRENVEASKRGCRIPQYES